MGTFFSKRLTCSSHLSLKKKFKLHDDPNHLLFWNSFADFFYVYRDKTHLSVHFIVHFWHLQSFDIFFRPIRTLLSQKYNISSSLDGIRVFEKKPLLMKLPLSFKSKGPEFDPHLWWLYHIRCRLMMIFFCLLSFFLAFLA